MLIEKVKAYLAGYGLDDRIREFPVSSATVALAAAAIGVEEARIAKSITRRHLSLCSAGGRKGLSRQFAPPFSDGFPGGRHLQQRRGGKL